MLNFVIGVMVETINDKTASRSLGEPEVKK
jgi:hypothetical protein